MMNPKDLRYTKEHEWVKIEGGIATVGVTDYAQKQLTDVVFVELPQKGMSLDQGKSAGAIESVKSVSDIFSPISGEVVEVNDALSDSPQLINEDPYGRGWIFKVKVSRPEEAQGLMDDAAYASLTEKEGH